MRWTASLTHPAFLAASLMVLGACSTTVVSGASDLTPGLVVATTTTPTTTTPPTTTTTTPPTTTTTAPPPTTTTEPPPTTTTLPDRTVAIDPLDPPLVAVGTSSGDETARIQQRLLDLGFWLSGADGEYGLTTRQAVMAFQKYAGLPASGSTNGETAFWLSAMDQRAQGRAQAGTLLEVDKSRQLIFFVVDGYTEWVINTSTGSEQRYEKPNKRDPSIIERGDSRTPNGLHFVNRQRADGWWDGDLGSIYRPKYFVGGVAVHGSTSIPNYPASHGCVRVSVPAMDWIWESELLPMDSPVWVHGSNP